MFPRTHLGRIIGSICAFWGVCITPLILLTLSNILNISSLGSKAYTVLHRLKKKDESRMHSAFALTRFMRNVGKSKDAQPDIENINGSFKKHMKEIRKTKR